LEEFGLVIFEFFTRGSTWAWEEGGHLVFLQVCFVGGFIVCFEPLNAKRAKREQAQQEPLSAAKGVCNQGFFNCLSGASCLSRRRVER
jgi:hypothetical protein